MSTDPSGGSPAHVDDARTDPFLPRITDEMLAARSVPVPVLDDRALAEMIAELDGDGPDHEAVPPRSQVPAQRAPTSPRARSLVAKVERVRTEPAWTEPDEPRTFGPDDDPSVLGDSADGPVLRSRYGDFRPPVPIGQRRRAGDDDWYLPDAPSLTGLNLTRRSWSSTGSRLFNWLFVALFALILAQAVIGLLTAAATP